jgi:hypothetical protein
MWSLHLAGRLDIGQSSVNTPCPQSEWTSIRSKIEIICRRDQAAHFHAALLLVPREPSGTIFLRGFSHAERPKDTAPIQTRCATYFPLKAVDAEWRPPQHERCRKRAKKL